MPYIDNHGVKIFYLEDGNGDGEPLILVHGLVGSLEDFYEWGWVHGLKGDYRLILLDVRGHGHSDKPHDPAYYGLDRRASDVEAVLDRLGIAKAHYLGFSMGGVMGFALARYAPHRLATLIAIGAHPYKRPGRSAYWRNQFSQGMEAYLKGNIADAPQLARTAWYFTRRLANDAEALIALNAGEDQGLEDIITANAIPCLLYIGTKDPNYGGTMRCAKEMPHAQLFELPDMAHGESFRAVDRGLPRVKAFLAANALQ